MSKELRRNNLGTRNELILKIHLQLVFCFRKKIKLEINSIIKQISPWNIICWTAAEKFASQCKYLIDCFKKDCTRARIILKERGQKIAMSSVQPTVARVYKIKIEPTIGNLFRKKMTCPYSFGSFPVSFHAHIW